MTAVANQVFTVGHEHPPTSLIDREDGHRTVGANILIAQLEERE